MGCGCGKKKGAVSVFSTEEQARIARQRDIRVASSPKSSSQTTATKSGT